MIDYFSIALTHGLILLAAWRLLFRDDLDADDPSNEARPRPWLKLPASKAKDGPGDD